ncbi:Protein with SprT-like domain at the N terminus [Balamuthia mandrillaris]
MNEVLKKEEENREEKGLHQDLLFALQLQEEERYNYKKKAASTIRQEQSPLLFAEETLDPTPDLHALFIHFNHQFFDEALSCVEVKWSKRMTLCAGLCTFEGKGGLCCVKLSEPLLKFRPRSDLISTLLHEMIHAFLFITVQERDRDAHGPSFQWHMQRINKEANTNITIYHSFHNEVDYHRVHWWRCSHCHHILKRSMNRPPRPSDPWWPRHQRLCGGTYTKIREPAGPPKRYPIKTKPTPRKEGKAKATKTRMQQTTLPWRSFKRDEKH